MPCLSDCLHGEYKQDSLSQIDHRLVPTTWGRWGGGAVVVMSCRGGGGGAVRIYPFSQNKVRRTKD